MSIFTSVKRIDETLEALVAAHILSKGITRADAARARGSRSEGTRHKGKPTYMRGNRRAA